MSGPGHKTGGIEQPCDHSPVFNYPASDGWRCGVCNELVHKFDDSDERTRGSQSQTSSSCIQSVDTATDHNGGEQS